MLYEIALSKFTVDIDIDIDPVGVRGDVEICNIIQQNLEWKNAYGNAITLQLVVAKRKTNEISWRRPVIEIS